MSFFDELENILSKAKAENSAPERPDEPAQPPAHAPDVVKPPATLAPIGLAVAPALSVPAPILSTPAPVATEVAPVPTVVEPLPTKPALSLAVPAPLTLAPAPVEETSAPTLTASASAGLPSRPSFNSAPGEKLPSLSLATEEPQEEEPAKTVRPSLVAASIAEVLSANKPTGLPVRPDTVVSVPQTENVKSPASAPDIEEEGEEWDGVALPSADSLVVAQAPILAAKAEVVSADPQNYIAAVSHAEDVTIRTNSLPEIKPAGQEYFFEDDDDEPVVF